jgi:hypothetical protein
MTQEEILDYNKLCAEFLGWEYAKDRDIWNPNMHHDYSFTYSINLKFHSDWNWIMEICISIGMEFVTTNKEQLIQQIYDKLRNMEINS